jgi:hypothetical protein
MIEAYRGCGLSESLRARGGETHTGRVRVRYGAALTPTCVRRAERGEARRGEGESAETERGYRGGAYLPQTLLWRPNNCTLVLRPGARTGLGCGYICCCCFIYDPSLVVVLVIVVFVGWTLIIFSVLSTVNCM